MAAEVVKLVINGAKEVKPEDFEKGGGGGGGAGGDRSSPDPIVYASDDYLANALTERLGDAWRSLSDGSGWRAWDGKRWADVPMLKVWAQARVVCRHISRDIEAAKLAREISSRSKAYAATALAATDPRHLTEIVDFDHDAFLLNTPDGVVNLRDGSMLAHDPALLLTRMTAAGPSGEAPLWTRFLNEATGGDLQLQAFLRRVAGYCLTGAIDEHAIFFLYDNGLGGTGKGTFVNTLAALLGDYATTAPINLFTVATGERHPAELAILNHVRLVTAAEPQEGERWDEAKLKAITGGDPITARKMRGDFFTFQPVFKLLMSGNHRPRMRSADGGMRRRFHLIPFVYKPAQADPELPAKLRDELPGILKWAIAGELERRRLGLAPPSVVVRATDDYFATENTLGRWIEERCQRGAALTALTRDLHRDYVSWAATVGEPKFSERVFSEKLQVQPGVERWFHPTTRRKGMRGLALLAQPDELPFGSGANAPSRALGGGAAQPQQSYREAGEWEADEPS